VRGADGQPARKPAIRQAGKPALPYRYSGLKDSAFGPLLQIPAIESRYGAGVSVNQPAFTGGRLKSQREGAVLQTSAAWQVRLASVRIAVLIGQNLPPQAEPEQAKPLSAVTLPAEAALLQSARTNRAARAARQLEAKAATIGLGLRGHPPAAHSVPG
jgi:outer membrane protein TolC